MNVGFIGTGSMGSTLIQAFLQSQALEPHQVILSNRTASKAEQLANAYPGILIAQSNLALMHQCEVIFLCIKPLQFKDVLEEIKSSVTSNHLIVSITSGLLIQHLENQLPAKICKIIPSVTQSICRGVSLVMHGTRMLPDDEQQIEALFAKISVPISIDESLTRICSDITSCGPAFISAFMEKFIAVAYEKTSLPPDQAIHLLTVMMMGTCHMLTSGTMTLADIKNRVAVPGGITTRGLQVIDRETIGLFEKLIDATHEKYAEDLEIANQRYTKNH